MQEILPFVPKFLAAYSILIVAASSPGPAVALLLGIGTSHGRQAALMTTFGIATGSAILNLLTLLGVGLIVAQAAWAMQIIRWIGAAYLLWLAYGAFRKAAHVKPITPHVADVPSAWRQFWVGFLLQVSNPKAIVFWLAISAVGATQGGGPLVIAAFFIGAFVISFACHGAWATLLSSTPFRAAYQRARRWVEAVLGVLFVGFAARMAFDR